MMYRSEAEDIRRENERIKALRQDKLECEKIDKAQQIRRENAEIEIWQADLRVSERLNDGIQRGETFTEFQNRTNCPAFLKERYTTEQRRSGIAPHSVKREDLFLKGFMRGIN